MKEVRKMFVQAEAAPAAPAPAPRAPAGTVLKRFSTVNRRFDVGDFVPADADLSPFGRETLVARGFIAG